MVNDTPQTLSFVAFHISDQVDIPRFRADFSATLLHSTSREVFYAVGADGYVHLFNYGVVVVCGLNDAEVTQILNLLSGYSLQPLVERLREDLDVRICPGEPFRFGFDDVAVPELDANGVRVVMRIMARSVAIRYFSGEIEQLLEGLGDMAVQLERTGRLALGKRRIQELIGRALNTHNRIISCVYVFDVSTIVWENQDLERLDTGLTDYFDLPFRQKGISTRLNTIESHIQVFSELSHNRESSRLEWIIILLIAIEVADLFISRLL
ncbi:hypothetical protein DSLASN_31510 [Desulfoluna limicola]|uniref:DUF155 domain-containing protein n=1 Tax=Desulfoluna limicola TaxID=2810562 RepID=A0ABM7PK74_9BACT|nr:RMD1 family protein [Desulfoluna limicola]BCS97519.1 hypothetical protein DSLASN_31510 [Desulfoluna limicola]